MRFGSIFTIKVQIWDCFVKLFLSVKTHFLQMKSFTLHRCLNLRLFWKAKSNSEFLVSVCINPFPGVIKYFCFNGLRAGWQLGIINKLLKIKILQFNKFLSSLWHTNWSHRSNIFHTSLFIAIRKTNKNGDYIQTLFIFMTQTRPIRNSRTESHWFLT